MKSESGAIVYFSRKGNEKVKVKLASSGKADHVKPGPKYA